jgi:phosphomannomutase
VEFDDDSWGLFRASNTSPKTTMRFEAPTQEKVNEMIDIFHEVTSGREYFDAEKIFSLKV